MRFTHTKEYKIAKRLLQKQANEEVRRWHKQRNPTKKVKKKTKVRIPKKYDVYIKSKWWTIRKNNYYRKFKKICRVCRSSKFIELHHIVYGNFGFEKDVDLMPLCKVCHKDFHDTYGTSGNMHEYTQMFLLEKAR